MQPNRLPDGVHIDLPHARYLREEEALGSTDFTKLYARGAGWWWQSKHNPHRPPPSTTEAQDFGTALHCLSFEGREKFAAQFATLPNKAEFSGVLTTADDIRSALRAKHVKGITSSTTKAQLVEFARAELQGVPIWDDIVARWERANKGKIPLSSFDSFALESMYSTALESEGIRQILLASEGVSLPELSVFWTGQDGIRRRFRFDQLLPDCAVDLKTLGDWRPRSMQWLAADRIAGDHLDVQMAMSFEARLALYQMTAAGRVFLHAEDGSMVHCKDERRTWLDAFLVHRPRGGTVKWAWVWLFYLKPSATGIPPILMPLAVDFGDALHTSGVRKYLRALRTYRENVERFGLDRPWTQVLPVHEARDGAVNRVVMPAWSEPPDSEDGEGDWLTW